MARPKKHRKCNCNPEANYFKPRGIPLRELKEVELEKDELEAIKLADYDGLAQEEAAIKMGISRQTFGRIVKSARLKIASALLNGNALKIND